MECPACGYSEMDEKTVDKTLSYGGLLITLRRMKGNFCPRCGDGVWDVKSYRRLVRAQEKIVTAARNDAGDDIRRIRKSLKVTQAELAKHLGRGKLAFSSYDIIASQGFSWITATGYRQAILTSLVIYSSALYGH